MRPRLIVTGASGFVGRNLLERLKNRYRIVGLARRSQAQSGAPIHPNISWHQVDIGERESLRRVFDSLRDSASEEAGDVVVHLAAHYDFTGEEHPEYERTNVHGLGNVLGECRSLPLRDFLFSSSLAACRFPPEGSVIDESTSPDGDHVYARTKRTGEEMLTAAGGEIPSTIVRFAALFSDWCEYPPLFIFLGTWLSSAWNRRVLAGRGRSAIPYLHVRDAARFVELLLSRRDRSEPGEVLICSPDGAVSHGELFAAATEFSYSHSIDPIFLPRPLCWVGSHARMLWGRIRGELPFERPWMVRYVDRQLTVDASRTRERIGWAPRDRLEILRRLPMLVENLRMEPLEWNKRNREAMKEVRLRPFLRIYKLLDKHRDSIQSEFTAVLTDERNRQRFPSYRSLSETEHRWNHTMALLQLMSAIRTRDRGIYLTYCRNLARRRREQGYSADEVCAALQELEGICMRHLTRDPESEPVREQLHSFVTMTMLFGCDQILETYEGLEGEVLSSDTIPV